MFVFPSLTDTFGLVLLEAMSCGVQAAAFPATGPIDVVQSGRTGVLNRNLRAAALDALKIDPTACREYALQHTWEAANQQFIANLVPRAEAPQSEAAATLSSA